MSKYNLANSEYLIIKADDFKAAAELCGFSYEYSNRSVAHFKGMVLDGAVTVDFYVTMLESRLDGEYYCHDLQRATHVRLYSWIFSGVHLHGTGCRSTVAHDELAYLLHDLVSLCS